MDKTTTSPTNPAETLEQSESRVEADILADINAGQMDPDATPDGTKLKNEYDVLGDADPQFSAKLDAEITEAITAKVGDELGVDTTEDTDGDDDADFPIL